METKMLARAFRIAFLAVACAGSVGVSVHAQGVDFPRKQVTIVVPYAAGGATDALARPLADKLGKLWGQAVVVENRVGANGAVGTLSVAKSEPDGHTVLLHSNGILRNHSHNRRLLDDLAGVTQIGTQPMGLAIGPSVPYATVDGLVAALKAKPTHSGYGSAGIGSTGHIYGEILNRSANAEIAHIPYGGEAPMLPDLISGRLTYGFVSLATGVARQNDKTLTILAITGTNRHSLLPAVPTLAELGLKGFDSVIWFGLFVPASTPKRVVEKLADDTRAVMQEPDMKVRVKVLAIELSHTTPTDFAKTLEREQEKWGALMKQFGIGPE